MKKPLIKATAVLLFAVMMMLPMTTTVLAAFGSDADVDRSSAARVATSSSNEFASSTKYSYSSMKSKINEYQQTNKDIVGWLNIPNTNINEPIAFSNQSNKYYLYRDWQGNNYPNTTYLNYTHNVVYADYRHVFNDTWQSSSKNTVLYGHNWTNLRNPLDIGNVSKHTMFGQLPSYTNLEFAQNNPYIYYSTDKNEGIWKVFAVGYCETSSNFFYNNPNPTTEAYEELLKEWKLRSLHNFDVDLKTTDRILTLSTCTRMYNASNQQRFVVVARLLRDGESENDSVTVTANPNFKAPQWS